MNSIMDTYKELLAVKNDLRWPSAHPRIMPELSVMEYTKRNGRKEGLLYNNRLHMFARGDGRLEMKNPEQYNINRDWILTNFKTKQQ